MSDIKDVVSDCTYDEPMNLRQRLFLAALGFFIILLYGSWWRPIAVDEFLHFSLGGLSFDEAVFAIQTTTGGGVNHGQTGVYMLVDYMLLQGFGASLVALRLPSLVAGVLLLVSAVAFIRARGLSFIWQVTVLCALAGQTWLMHYAGEARPYMVLAATSCAALTYYCYAPRQRAGWLARCLGVAGVCIGAVMHPYFPMVLVLILSFALWFRWRERSLTLSTTDLARFANVPLLAIASLLYLTVGRLTWMRSSPQFEFDPFEIIGTPLRVVASLLNQHLLHADTDTWMDFGPLLLAVAVILTTVWTLVRSRFRNLTPLAAPTVLLAVAIGSSVLFSYISFMRSYWIISRQWVAGMALATIALVWLFGELAGMAKRLERDDMRWPVRLYGALVIVTFVMAVASQTANFHANLITRQAFVEDSSTIAQLTTLPHKKVDWIYAANINAARGGGVWPELATAIYIQDQP